MSAKLKEPSEPPIEECPNSPDKQHEGYWINRGVNFRCYHCGMQLYLGSMEKPTPHSRIETWKGGH